MRWILVIGAIFLGGAALVAQSTDKISAEDGDILITPGIHASVQIEYAGKVIHVDPWSVADLSALKAADLILVTDDPGHHMDVDAITALRKPRAPVVLTADAQKHYPEGQLLANGESGTFSGIQVEAIPAYDLTPGEPLHPKGQANGYVLSLGGRRIYLSGVTECVPEIQALQDISVAFLPMNLPVDRMHPIPTAECLKTFKPEVVYLYHYDQAYASWLSNPDPSQPRSTQDTPATIQKFRNAIASEGIEFRDRSWYPDW